MKYLRSLVAVTLALGLIASAWAVTPTTKPGNAAYTIRSTDTYVITTTAFSASRTWTLPGAAATCIGQTCQPAKYELVIEDVANTVTSSNTLVIARATGDLINGAAGNLTISQAGARVVLTPVASNNWTAVVSYNSAQTNNTFDTLTANAIAAGDSSLGITGQAAAQGGAILITGGTSATAANAGGAVGLVGGTPGATGVGGAVNLTGGAAVAGVGGAVTLTGGASAGGTASGADINLVPTAAVSTGIPGTVKFNGDASLTCPTFYTQGAPAANTDTVFFVATRPFLVVSASQVHAIAAGGTSTAQITKDTSTNAPGAGTDLLSAAFNLNATANTVQAGALVATIASKTLAAGDRLAVDFADAVQASSGIAITVCLAPL